MNALQRGIRFQQFALVELALIVLCGAVWMIQPQWGIWFILIALLPLARRLLVGGIHILSVDWLVIVFLLTAWIGYWAAYDPAAAWNKVWLIVTSVLLYFSLKDQPRENLYWVSIFLFCVAIGVSLYYLLTHDFVTAPRKLELVNSIGRWLMNVRPETDWMPIHPNYAAGIISITTPFIFYPVWELRKRDKKFPRWLSLTVSIAVGLAGLTLVMTTSRGVLFAIVSALGGWLLWRSVYLTRISRRLKNEAVYPILLFVFLCAVTVFLYTGPARSGSVFSSNYHYGDGSREELFSRSIYLLFAYPITGGGLTSFPGLYSQYLLDIPFYNVPNSHNLFLDVGIEQGIFGGLAFLFLYLSSLWMTAQAVSKNREDQVFHWVLLFSLVVAIIHGLVDDYLYNGAGTFLSLLLAGLAMNGRNQYEGINQKKRVNIRVAGFAALVCIGIISVFGNKIRAVWYENLGAVQLAKLELAGFPQNRWVEWQDTSKLDMADASLHFSVQLDPSNRPANQRLGLISMLQEDFASAMEHLEAAYAKAPMHRGVVKALGYDYVWLGDFEKAKEFLSQIPEAKEELGVYVWWWKAQGRNDLSDNASKALDFLNN